MDASIATAVTDILRTLPKEGAGRDLVLQQLTEVCAAAEAAAALRDAARRAREAAGRPGSHAPAATALADVLSAASATWDAALPSAVDSTATAGGRPMLPRIAATPQDREAEARRREELRRAAMSPPFLTLVSEWIREMREVAADHPETGACTIATAVRLWMWTASHVQRSVEAARRDAVAAELAEAFSPLAAARAQILEVVRGGHERTAGNGAAAQFLADLCHVQSARSAAAVAAACADVVFGYRKHPAWDADGCASCYQADDLDALEAVIPGIASSARAHSDVIEADGSHAIKAGPCARFDGVDTFSRLRTRLDACLTGARLAKDRAADALPAALAALTAAPAR